MVNRRFKNVGLFLAAFLHSSLASNDTDKSSSESFLVSANLGVSEHTKPHLVQNEENTQRNVPLNNFQPYIENSLFVNKNYQDYSKSLNEGHAENTQHNDVPNHNQNDDAYLESFPRNEHYYHENDEILPAPNEWKANFDPNPCQRYEEASSNKPESYNRQSYHGSYAGHSESTTPTQPFQQPQENYLLEALNKNEVVDPLPITSYQSYSPNIRYDMQNTYNNDGYHEGKHNHFENIVYGSHNSNGEQDSQWIGTNRKISNDRAYEGHKNWATDDNLQRNDKTNDFHKPNVVELQEMINKIVKGNSKVHQVLKVPAVYEIHLQEEENTSGHAPIQQKWQSSGGSPHHWRKKRPPSIYKPTKYQQFFRGGPSSTKTWNLPAKINYFNNRDSISEGSNSQLSYGKYAYPKPFSTTGTGQEIPLQQWYNSPRTNNHNRNFDRRLPSGPPVYGSVSVPMTPGSTEVTFIDNGNDNGVNFGRQNNIDTSLLNSAEGRPDLSNYYAKKKEIENSSFQGNNGIENVHRGNNAEGSRRNFRRNYRIPLRKREERNFFPLNNLNNLNYIIYVREKSRG